MDIVEVVVNVVIMSFVVVVDVIAVYSCGRLSTGGCADKALVAKMIIERPRLGDAAWNLEPAGGRHVVAGISWPQTVAALLERGVNQRATPEVRLGEAEEVR